MFPNHEWNNNVRTDTCISEQVAKTFDKRFIETFENNARQKNRLTIVIYLYTRRISILFLFFQTVTFIVLLVENAIILAAITLYNYRERNWR